VVLCYTLRKKEASHVRRVIEIAVIISFYERLDGVDVEIPRSEPRGMLDVTIND
jgi:hypothetical protein